MTPREPETAGDGIGMIQAVLDIEGEDLGLLIGRRGQTLSSLQYLLNLICSKKVGKRVSLRRGRRWLSPPAGRGAGQPGAAHGQSCTQYRAIRHAGADAAKRAPYHPPGAAG